MEGCKGILSSKACLQGWVRVRVRVRVRVILAYRLLGKVKNVEIYNELQCIHRVHS